MNQRYSTKKDNKKRIKKVAKLNEIKKEFQDPNDVCVEIRKEITKYLKNENFKNNRELIIKISNAIKKGMNNSSISLKIMFDEIAQVVVMMYECVKIISKSKDISENDLLILKKDIEVVENLVKWVEMCPILHLSKEEKKQIPKNWKH